jgi:uncharacterized protein (DUF4415 family)
MKNERITTKFSRDQLEARRSHGKAHSDLARARAKTETELEQDIASDPDFRDQPVDWYKAAKAIMPAPKQALSLRLDTAVVDWFRDQGPGYQTRINAVLRAFVAQQIGRGK